MSYRSPLRRVLGLGSAQEGVSHWIGQRVSAVALVLLSGWFLASILQVEDMGYISVVDWMRIPINAVLLTLLIVALTYHARLGLRVVIEDYISHKFAKSFSLLIINFALIVLQMIGVFSVFRVAFGTAP